MTFIFDHGFHGLTRIMRFPDVPIYDAMPDGWVEIRGATTAILYDYCIKALLPHMVYYCAHTLHLGQDRSLTCSRQAVGLILTKIVGGRPVTNITFTCKRMLRTYKNRGDFWYYDKAPEAVKLMVNRIDMSALAELYKVTKDRRI